MFCYLIYVHPHLQPPGFESKEQDHREKQQDYGDDDLGEFFYLKHGDAQVGHDVEQDVAGDATVIPVENPVAQKGQRENIHDEICGVDDIGVQHLIVVIALD